MEKFSLLVKISQTFLQFGTFLLLRFFFLLLPPVSLFCGLALVVFDFADFVPPVFLT